MTRTGFTLVRETTNLTIKAEEPVFRSFTDESADAQGSGGNPNIITVITASPHGAEIGDTVYFKGITDPYDVLAATITSVPQDDELTYEVTTNIITTLITGVLIIYDSYELDEDTPPNLGPFIHLDLTFGSLGHVSITLDNGTTWRPLNNENDLIGTVFFSKPIIKGDAFNVRFEVNQGGLTNARLFLEE